MIPRRLDIARTVAWPAWVAMGVDEHGDVFAPPAFQALADLVAAFQPA